MALIIIPAAAIAVGAVARAFARRKASGARLGGLVRLGSDAADAATQVTREHAVSESRPAPPEVSLILRRMADGAATTADVQRGSALARAAGMNELASKLGERAQVMAEIDALFETTQGAAMPGAFQGAQDVDVDEGGDPEVPQEHGVASGGMFQSPISEANDEQWTRFVEALATGEPGKVNANGSLGRWMIDYRQLKDLGLVTDVKARTDGAKGYTGTWKPIAGVESNGSEAAFLADEGAQYMALVSILLAHYKSILGEWTGQIGGVLDRKNPVPISLSGLMGVARKAGMSGLGSWLSKEEDRKKFTMTTDCFDRCNGIF